jgi:hypothetical protein
MTASEYINLDLGIESSDDLTPLAEYLDQNACLLSHENIKGIDYITVEASLGSDGATPEVSANKMLTLIESMPEHLYRLFKNAKSRIFDFGFKGGYETNPYRTDLGSGLLIRTATHNIAFRFTIYSYRKEDTT